MATVNGVNYWYFGTHDGVTLNNGEGITPEEAYSIDFKLDDGKPLTGNVRFAARLNLADQPPEDNECIGDNNEYDIVNAERVCAITVRVKYYYSKISFRTRC